MKDRVYIFSYGKSVEWTSSTDDRDKMMSTKGYEYKGYIDCDNKTSGGPNLNPFNGRNTPLA